MATVTAGAIYLWRFAEAPPAFRALSKHGGDEDYLAYVPQGVCPPWWMEAPSAAFGACDVSRHEVPGGATVYIGAHA